MHLLRNCLILALALIVKATTITHNNQKFDVVIQQSVYTFKYDKFEDAYNEIITSQNDTMINQDKLYKASIGLTYFLNFQSIETKKKLS